MLFEFLAWLQEQEQYWKVEGIPSKACEPENPQEHPHDEMQELNQGTHTAQAAQTRSDEVGFPEGLCHALPAFQIDERVPICS